MENKTDPKSTALLVMDVQALTVNMIANSETLLKPLNKAIQKARAGGIPIIYVVIGFRKGYPEVSASNKSFSQIAHSTGMNIDTEEATRVHASVAPAPGDIIVTKKRVSAFAGSDLEIVLRSGNIKHLVLTGIATSGVVLSTIREAADKDYVLTVLSDCCADRDEEVHRVLTTKVFIRQADVLTADTWPL